MVATENEWKDYPPINDLSHSLGKTVTSFSLELSLEVDPLLLFWSWLIKVCIEIKSPDKLILQ